MKPAFLADQCVPQSILDFLRDAQFDVVALRDVLPIRAPDPQVIAKATELDKVLVSLNGDFSDIVSYPPRAYRGIVAVQLDNHPEAIPTLMTRLLGYLQREPDRDHYIGRLLIVEPHRIRVRI
jgi:predicted nuclease of predicted toxin-antitoxin system